MNRPGQVPLYFITGSEGKFAEVQALIPDIGRLDLDLPEIQELDSRRIVAAKLAEARRHHDGAFLVEDTSLGLDALGGLPGPFIKWFLARLGEGGLVELTGKLGDDRARARTVVGYAAPGGEIAFFEGETIGRIVAPQGDRGFGWDRIFLPAGADLTCGEMAPQEKQAFSMRRTAIERFAAFYRERPAMT